MRGQIVFYNTENLMDTYDDPATDDDSYTPMGDRNWTEERYQFKIERISKVIKEISPDYPLLVGLCEIENKKVLQDLLRHPNLQDANYQFVHRNGNDERGIESALLYQRDYVKIKQVESIPIHFEFDAEDRTRDILYIQLTLEGETLEVFINHWPSRREGMDQSTAKHMIVVEQLRHKINSVLATNPSSKILVMGDFNDTPEDIAVRIGLSSGVDETFSNNQLFYNLAGSYTGNKVGTSTHRGDYYMFDQMLVTKNWLEGKGWQVTKKEVTIFKPNWLTFKHPRYKDILPDRTYAGNTYKGGYSDHFPISLTIEQA